jgi:branched-chain amino acid transport system substrate-binding protein
MNVLNGQRARTNRRLVVFAAAATTILLAGTFALPSAAEASSSGIPAGPIKIGIIAALSGPNAAVGELIKGDSSAIIAKINASGGVDGHQLDLVVDNSEGNPATAVSDARQFAADHVVATLYNGATDEGKDQVVSVENAAHIIGVAEESLDQYQSAASNPYYFNVNPLDSQTTAGIASFAKARGLNDIGELGDGTPFATSLEQNFATAAKKNGLHVVKTVSYPDTATSMTTELSLLRQAGAKTLALWCEVGCGQAIASLHTLGWDPPILSGDLLSLLAFSSLKNFGPTTYESCPYSVKPGGSPTAAETAVVNLIAPKFGGESAEDFGFIEEADDIGVLEWAIKKADSTNGAKLKAALESMKDQHFTNEYSEYSFSPTDHSGYQATTSNGQIPMCGLSKLGALDLPIQVASS